MGLRSPGHALRTPRFVNLHGWGVHRLPARPARRRRLLWIGAYWHWNRPAKGVDPPPPRTRRSHVLIPRRTTLPGPLGLGTATQRFVHLLHDQGDSGALPAGMWARHPLSHLYMAQRSASSSVGAKAPGSASMSALRPAASMASSSAAQ